MWKCMWSKTWIRTSLRESLHMTLSLHCQSPAARSQLHIVFMSCASPATLTGFNGPSCKYCSSMLHLYIFFSFSILNNECSSSCNQNCSLWLLAGFWAPRRGSSVQLLHCADFWMLVFVEWIRSINLQVLGCFQYFKKSLRETNDHNLILSSFLLYINCFEWKKHAGDSTGNKLSQFRLVKYWVSVPFFLGWKL